MNGRDMEKVKEMMNKEGTCHLFKHRGLQCIIIHRNTTHRCGYVELPDILRKQIEDEALKLQEDYAIELTLEKEYKVHGGITFASTCIAGIENPTDNKIFIGFDCAHAGDTLLGYKDMYGTYKDKEFVTNECKKLAEQIVNKLKAL